MVIDNKGKIFGKVSIIDIFVVLLVAVVVFGTVYKFKSPATSNITGGNTPIYFKVKIEDVRSLALNYYEEDMDVYDSKTGNYLGKIRSISSSPYVEEIEKADGSVIKTEKADKIQIDLEIEAKGVETEQSFLVEGTYEVKVGAGIYLMTKYVLTEGTVMEVHI